MIVVKIQAGLGNQMFQYAAGKSLASKYKTRLLLDTRWFDNIPEQDTPRRYELDTFCMEQEPFDAMNYQIISRGLGRRSKYALLAKSITKKKLWSFECPDNTFNKDFMSLPDNCYLDGWFTSEKYFSDVRDVIIKDFSFSTTPGAISSRMLDEIASVQSVSIHVRRGDYITNKHASGWHGLTGIDYYRAAVSKLATKVKEPEFFIFSDDIVWCKDSLKLPYPTTYVSHNTSGAEDMRLMIACRHNIITNSSFSWWAAWLNTNENKIVIAPKQWLSDPTIDTGDVVPGDWLRI